DAAATHSPEHECRCSTSRDPGVRHQPRVRLAECTHIAELSVSTDVTSRRICRLWRPDLRRSEVPFVFETFDRVVVVTDRFTAVGVQRGAICTVIDRHSSCELELDYSDDETGATIVTFSAAPDELGHVNPDMAHAGESGELSSRPADIVTPVGTVVLSTRLGMEVVAGSTSARTMPSGAVLHHWDHPSATVDVVTGQVRNNLYINREPLTVTALWAAIWQIRARSRVPELELRAELTDIPTDAHRSPDCGEHLEALTIDTTTTILSMGGPDLELLSAQAETGRHLPLRWAQHLPRSWADNATQYSVTSCYPAQLTWRLPDLEPGEAIELCVAIAWRPQPAPQDPNNIDAWLAVDLPIGDALEQLLPSAGSAPHRA
ncbi:hypothetical protein, partial [Nocardia seriolae]